MIPSTNKYKGSIYAPIREIQSRVTLTMDVFKTLPPQVFDLGRMTFEGKTKENTIVNPHICKYAQYATLQPPNGVWAEAVSYPKMSTLDGVCVTTSNTTAGTICQFMYSFNVLEVLERRFGRNIWQGKTTTADKIVIAKSIVNTLACYVYAYGTSPKGNNISLAEWSNGSWVTTNNHKKGTPSLLTVGARADWGVRIPDAIDANGMYNILLYTDASDGTTASAVFIDYIEFNMIVNQTTTRTFYDNRVVSANIVEEVYVLNTTVPANQLSLCMDNTDDLFSFLTLGNMPSIVASRPKIDVEFGLVLEDGSLEWVPMGSFFVDNWKNDVGSLTVTFTAHDYIWTLGNSSIDKQPIVNCGKLAEAIFKQTGITNYYIDPVVYKFVGNNKMTWSNNCRDLLQSISIITGTTLHQDRYGQVKLEVFPTLLTASSYTIKATTQNALYGYVSPTTYEEQDTEGGMKHIDMDAMYNIPSVTLDQSIFQVSINVYTTDPTNNNSTPTVFTNNMIQGNSGQSFSLDVPLITSVDMAKKIAQRFFDETSYNAVYNVTWRQNPILETTDVIIVDDSNNTSKQTRITKQEFNYKGFLKGTTESRGGV